MRSWLPLLLGVMGCSTSQPAPEAPSNEEWTVEQSGDPPAPREEDHPTTAADVFRAIGDGANASAANNKRLNDEYEERERKRKEEERDRKMKDIDRRLDKLENER